MAVDGLISEASSAGVYIDTGINQIGDIEVFADFQSTKNEGDRALFGARASVSSSAFCFFSSANDGKYRSDYGDNKEIFTISSSLDTDRHTISKVNNLTYIDDVLVSTIVSSAPTTPVPISIFGRNDNGTVGSRFVGIIYAFRITKEGVLVQNLVPVRRLIDNVYGMWDTVTESFFGNVGTSAFTGGADLYEAPTILTNWATSLLASSIIETDADGRHMVFSARTNYLENPMANTDELRGTLVKGSFEIKLDGVTYSDGSQIDEVHPLKIGVGFRCKKADGTSTYPFIANVNVKASNLNDYEDWIEVVGYWRVPSGVEVVTLQPTLYNQSTWDGNQDDITNGHPINTKIRSIKVATVPQTEDVPTDANTIPDIKAWLDIKEISYISSASKSALLALVFSWLNDNR
ncbi:hypothetical protein [Pseudolactococcus reticulitermitis]|uniref:Uncharacterized protein n=1 Tax=Pseudolactococcus reticulitermitis TaxID=2025039 RepID=A0A224XAT4_9LACT|nr:hypothetical protein [Lactococcus reticulitermitis]GAX46773.1 hypothetical protein RsY01_352 [Lactococcus reticulitermitis]